MNNLPLPLKILADDRHKIVYRPAFAKITGSVLGAILLQQILYRFDANGSQKFYKFMQPCTHKLYKKDDSWSEELGFSRYELAAALKVIATKSTAGANKKELMAVVKPEFNDKGTMTNAALLVIYWTDSSRVTWFWLNSALLGNAVVQHYLANSDVQQYLVNQTYSNTYENLDSGITSNTENTPKKTTEKKAKREPHLDRWDKVAAIGNALLKVFKNDFVPVENQTFAALEPYTIAAEDLTRVGAPVEHIEPLYKYILARSERENWNGFTVKALPKYYTEFLKSLKKTSPARRPAPITNFNEPTAAELEAQRAELEAARKTIRPEWEQKAVVNE